MQRLEIGGSRLHPSECHVVDEEIFDNFCYAFANTANRLTTKNEKKDNDLFDNYYDGIILIIDEADNSSKELDLGSFLKLFSERMIREKCYKVMIGLSGLPILRTILLDSHESSLRIFDELFLNRLNSKEIDEVIDLCLKESNEVNDVKTTISQDGRQTLNLLSEGYPHFIQQFGFSAFEIDDDNVINETDVTAGAFGEFGALELIGERYYRHDFYNKIQQENYRQILRIMSEKYSSWITRDELKKLFKGKDTQLDNALRSLKKNNIIIPKEGERGIYRLQNAGFALWIKLKTSPPPAIRQK